MSDHTNCKYLVESAQAGSQPPKLKYHAGGIWRESTTDTYMNCYNPSTGEVIALAPQCTSAEVEEIIARHGLEEWKACLLTNEFHRHLGIYSLIGAKMGTRARELLQAPFDTLEVISLAGNKPPLSCLNDGLQVSTGASLGRGMITISENEKQPQPGAMFTFQKHKLTLKLKKKIVDQVKSDIQAAVNKFGGLNQAYFAHVRQLSIEYWLKLDRKEIFEINWGP